MIVKIHNMNSDVLQMYANYLRNDSRFITRELISEIVDACNVSEEYAFYVLLAAACGLDIDENERDKYMAKHYLMPSIKKLDVNIYKENPYYRNIRIPEMKMGDWELRYEEYNPYEAFIYDDIIVDEKNREIPRLGFFSEEFTFPAVLEAGVEWMTITPNEIETMKAAIHVVQGKVVTFGLGLGYFAYMVSEKTNVTSITIIEQNKSVIALFEQYILPQFSHREKVRIICEDAFIYARDDMKNEEYDYAFVDLWHDASDGVGMYLRMKKLEDLSVTTKFLYWVEETILSNLRWHVSEVLLSGWREEEKDDRLPEREVQRYEEDSVGIMGAIESYFKYKKIKYDDLAHYLGNVFLRELAKEL